MLPAKKPTTTKAPATPATQQALHNSWDVPTIGLMIMLYGEDGVGKSGTALTISKQCPVELPAKQRTELTDTFVIGADSQALKSMKSLNLSVPAYFDVPVWLSQHKGSKFGAGVSAGLNQFTKWLQVHPGGNLIVDTLSAISRWFNVDGTFDKSGHMPDLGADINRNAFKHAWACHQILAETIKRTDFGTCVYLCHPKAVQDFVGDSDVKAQKQAAAVKRAGKALEGAQIIPNVTGGGITAYQNDCFFIFPIVAKRAPKSATRKRYILTRPDNADGFHVKNKCEGVLNAEEPAHLRLLIEKIYKA